MNMPVLSLYENLVMPMPYSPSTDMVPSSAPSGTVTVIDDESNDLIWAVLPPGNVTSKVLLSS